MQLNIIHNIDCLTGLRQLPDNCVDCLVTSPPYWSLRSYDCDGQIGLEDDFNDYITRLIDVFAEIKRVLKKTGTCFVNLGDTYGGAGHGYDTKWRKSKERYKLMGDNNKTGRLINTSLNKSMLLLPYRFAIWMVESGWKLRNIIIWHKPNQLPQGVFDRFTNDFEPVFFFTKTNKYFFNQLFERYEKPLARWGGDNLVANGTSEWSEGTGQRVYRNRKLCPNPQGRNMRCVWSINTKGEKEKHYASYPQKLIGRLIEAGCPEGGIVLDPFMGSGTTAVVARKLNRNYIGFELNAEYVEIANRKLNRELGIFREL